MAEKHANIMATNQFKVIALSTYFITSLVLPTMVIWLIAVSFDPSNFLNLTVGYLRKFLKIAFFHIEPFLLFTILAIASVIYFDDRKLIAQILMVLSSLCTISSVVFLIGRSM